jgi:hypothetical protein
VRRYSPTFEPGASVEVAKIVKSWSANNQLVGFSIVEPLNSKNGVILQRLINPNVVGITEPNLILHYNDCLQNRGRELNMGACVGIKSMEFAKRKLNPIRTVQINRIKPGEKLTKEQYQKIN